MIRSFVGEGGRESARDGEGSKGKGPPYTMLETFWIDGSSPSIDESEIKSRLQYPYGMGMDIIDGCHQSRYPLQLAPLPFHSLY